MPYAESDAAAVAFAADSSLLKGRPRFLGFESVAGLSSEFLNGRPRFFGVRLGISTTRFEPLGGRTSRGVEDGAGLGASELDLLSPRLRDADLDISLSP